ncbi:phycobilisome protein [Leptolyngbya cf. ectocarpi LEGE 11479]|uniref:Phycobilisome protein n=1 Tax=Leptolyngbya cf. ectocarpi LEGE 11479 TaxID=1828722 RepID=A0A928ZV99_LEPEC|nr:phycobilisome protein [Leptolyngbya ectocarpi]MBE9068073.1 phycobilisome protein [Leptolyngbya cf. ectocarpi LEGE 11479]
MVSPLSPRVKELILKARIVSFEGWQDQFGADAIAALQTADDERCYLDDAVLETMAGGTIARALRNHASVIVDGARAQLLVQFPGITEPGGGLYPAVRAEACWRDFWHFLRCTTYGIAAQRTDYTSATGLTYMEQLYHELHVPLDAMVYGLSALKMASKQQLTQLDLAFDDDHVTPYFDHLIQALSQFHATD